MDIQGTNSGAESARRAYEQRMQAQIDANRALVRASRDAFTPPAQEVSTESQRADARKASEGSSRRDAIELSVAARADQPSPAEREARVRELTEEHRAQRLNTAERFERAAQRLLGG